MKTERQKAATSKITGPVTQYWPAYLGQLPQHIGSLAFAKFSEKGNRTWESEEQIFVIGYRELPSAKYLMQRVAWNKKWKFLFLLQGKPQRKDLVSQWWQTLGREDKESDSGENWREMKWKRRGWLLQPGGCGRRKEQQKDYQVGQGV